MLIGYKWYQQNFQKIYLNDTRSNIHRYYISTVYELDTIAFDPVSCFDYQLTVNIMDIDIANTDFVIIPQVRKYAAAF